MESSTKLIHPVTGNEYGNINHPNVYAPLAQPMPPSSQIPKRCFYTFALIVYYVISIASIVVGAIRLNDCPAEKMLPIGLIIFGSMMIISRLVNGVYDYRIIFKGDSGENIHQYMIWVNVLFGLVEFCMFITVFYWIFSITPTSKPEERGSKNYCDGYLYKTSYFFLCLFGIMLGRYCRPFWRHMGCSDIKSFRYF